MAQSPGEQQINQEQLNNFLGPVNGALGGLSVAEKNQSYFIVFQQAGGTGPEIIDQTAYFITYLVDENGNVSKPSEDYDSLNNLIQNFEIGGNVIVRNDASTALNSSLTGRQLITAIGSQEPILYSQTGSSISASVDEINFNQGNTAFNQITAPDIRGRMNKSNPTTITQTPSSIIDFDIILNPPPQNPQASFNLNGSYSLESAGLSSIQNILFSISSKFTNNDFNPTQIALSIEKTGDPGGPSIIATENYTLSGNSSLTINPFNYLEENINNLGLDPVYRLKISANNAQNLTADWVNFNIIKQVYPPGVSEVPILQTPFWVVGSHPDITWLTGSQYLSINYGLQQDSTNILNVVEPGFNFSPIATPFNLQSGDRVRFGYNPSNDYVIYDVIPPSEDPEGLLRVKLNKVLPGDLYLNNFVFHRVNVNDPAYIILDVKKDESVNDTQNFNGVILPEYPTKRLKDNLDNIIIDLKSRGIITDNEN